MDAVTQLLLDALKLALAEPGEQRLFKSGKLDGLFAARTGTNGEAATRALEQGLLEVVRTETKGKTTIEWVRTTPRAVEFLHEQESPIQALKDLQTVLQANRAAIPLWLAEMQHALQALAAQLAGEAERWTHRLDALCQQVETALAQIVEARPPLPRGMDNDVPFAADALAYLDHRRSSGANGACPLSELFAALRERHPELSLNGFHTCLRRLQEHRAVQLLPFTGSPSEIPEPEYALLDGSNLLYYVTR